MVAETSQLWDLRTGLYKVTCLDWVDKMITCCPFIWITKDVVGCGVKLRCEGLANTESSLFSYRNWLLSVIPKSSNTDILDRVSWEQHAGTTKLNILSLHCLIDYVWNRINVKLGFCWLLVERIRPKKSLSLTPICSIVLLSGQQIRLRLHWEASVNVVWACASYF